MFLEQKFNFGHNNTWEKLGKLNLKISSDQI